MGSGKLSELLKKNRMIRGFLECRHIRNNANGRRVLLADLGKDTEWIRIFMDLFKVPHSYLTPEAIASECSKEKSGAAPYIYLSKNEYLLKNLSILTDGNVPTNYVDYKWFTSPDINPQLDAIDPILGFGHFKEEGGFSYLGEKENPDLVIYVLGNSTSDDQFGYYKSWCGFLYDMLSEGGRKVLLVNGAMTRTNSAQELMKLIRDVIPQKPDIVLTFSGVCNIDVNYDKILIKDHPFIWDYTDRYMKNSILGHHVWMDHGKNVRIKDISYGLPDKRSYAKWWAEDIRMMHAVCSEFGIKFAAFLQPSIFIGDYIKTGAEHIKEDPEYVSRVRAWYEEVGKEIAGLDYIYDLSDFFSGYTNIYYDSCHVFESGNRMLAERICEVVTEMIMRK